jgi:ABC-2 type transport system permease protein
MMLIVITYYSAEVVWRERNSGMGDIVDSMPVFNLTFWLSKLLSVFLVITLLFLVGMVVAIANQLIKGHAEIDIAQYLISLLFFYALPTYITVVLAFFIQVLSPNKFVGMLIFVGYILSSLVFNELGLEHNMYNYGDAPNLSYSDMNGYGWYIQTQSWYMIYWGALAVALSTIGYAMWQRGPQVPLSARFKLLSYQLGAKGKLTLASSLTVFVLVGGFIYYNI